MIPYAIAVGVVIISCTILWKRLSVKKNRFPRQYSHDNGRPQGALENVWTLAHDMNGSLLIGDAVVFRSKSQIQASVLKRAMELLMKRHPLLRMCIRKNQDGEYCLQKMENVHLDLCQLDSEDWRNVMEESLLEKFDSENGPLWRVTFLPNAKYEPQTLSDISDVTSHPHEYICIFNFHHAIIDGMSRYNLIGEFTTYVSKLNNNEEPKVTSMAMLPPLDFYLGKCVTLKWYHHFMKLVLELLCIIPRFPAFAISAMSKMSGGNPFTRKFGVEIERNPQIQPRTKIIPVEFTKDETSCLLKKCKEFHTTVQGAVQIAAGVAMVTMMEEQECEVEFFVTINARPFLKSSVSNDYVGSYISAISCNNMVCVSPIGNKFWIMARNASEDLHARLRKNEHIESMMKFTYCFPSAFVRAMVEKEKNKDEKSGQRTKHLIVFTNLGNCKFLDGSPDDDVILQARFNCTAEHQQGAVFANNLATFNGKLFWTFVYYSNITSDETAQKCVGLVKATILNAIRD